jgi:hypothetical protein
MMTEMKDRRMETKVQRPPLRIGLLVAGALAVLVGGLLLIEELTDLLRNRPDLDETFGALVAIAIGLMLLAAGGLLGDGPHRLGVGFGLATGGIALVAAAGAYGLGLLVDLGTAGALAAAVGMLLAVAVAAGLLAAVVDRRWGLAGGLAVVALLVGVGVVAALVAALAYGVDVPDWVRMLDD